MAITVFEPMNQGDEEIVPGNITDKQPQLVKSVPTMSKATKAKLSMPKPTHQSTVVPEVQVETKPLSELRMIPIQRIVRPKKSLRSIFQPLKSAAQVIGSVTFNTWLVIVYLFVVTGVELSQIGYGILSLYLNIILLLLQVVMRHYKNLIQ